MEKTWRMSTLLGWKIRRYPKNIHESPRIGIPNKGEWTDMLLRFSVDKHPYVSNAKKYTKPSLWGNMEII